MRRETADGVTRGSHRGRGAARREVHAAWARPSSGTPASAMMLRCWVALALTGLLAGAGCGDEFRTAGQLNENPQILAIDSEPPDVPPGAEVELEALVHWPDGAPTLVWLVCIPEVGDTISTCLANAFSQGGGQPPRCDQNPGARFCLGGIGPTLRYRVPLDAFPDDGEPHTFFVNLLATDSLDGFEACGALLAGEAPPSDNCLLAIKRVVVFDGETHNENPAIEHLTLRGSPLGSGEVVLDPAASGTDLEDYRVMIGVQVDPASVDELRPAEGDAPTEVNLVASWFADCGKMREEKVFVPCAAGDPEAGTGPTCEVAEVRWRPRQSGTCLLHVVVRDGNGGTTWRTQEFRIE